MCIAIHKPKGIKLDYALYAECFSRNEHGSGIAYVDQIDKKGNRGIVIDKGFFNAPAMIKAIQEEEDREMLIHFRRASCGGITSDMCHPFGFHSRTFPQYSFALIHNGTLATRNELKKSDTACFVDDILEPHLDRDPFFLDYAPGRFMLANTIGKNNKFVIMRYDKRRNETKVFIINETEGVKDKGCWFSNSSYKPLIQVGGSWDNTLFPGRCWPDGEPVGGFVLNEHGIWVRPANHKAVKQVKQRLLLTGVKKDGEPRCPLEAIINFNLKLQEESDPMAHINRALEQTRRDVQKTLDARGKIVPFDPKATSAADTADGVEPDAVLANASLNKGAEGTARIEVPRDADIAAAQGGKRGADTRHLTKRERKDLKKLCSDYLRSTGVGDWAEMEFLEQLSWVRDDLREKIVVLTNVDDTDVDRWLLVEFEEYRVRRAKEHQDLKNLALQQKAEREEALKTAQETVGGGV